MKYLGIGFIILGLIGTVFFGLEASNDSESFEALGAEVMVSQADWTPVIVSGVVLIVGILIMLFKKK